jgi:hypothetical protein
MVLGFRRDKFPISKTYSSMRRQLIDYYGTRPKKRQDLKKIYSYCHKREAKEEIRSLHLHKMISQAKFSQKELNNSLAKSHIYMAKRRYSTSYWSINFTILSATGLASSTYLTNWSWSHFEHMPSPRTPILAQG